MDPAARGLVDCQPTLARRQQRQVEIRARKSNFVRLQLDLHLHAGLHRRAFVQASKAYNAHLFGRDQTSCSRSTESEFFGNVVV
jgi:hypothetical protein